MKKFLLSIFILLSALMVSAQGDVDANNNNWMTGNHKIFVVVAVLAIILSAMFIFLFSIERRLKKLESNLPANR